MEKRYPLGPEQRVDILFGDRGLVQGIIEEQTPVYVRIRCGEQRVRIIPWSSITVIQFNESETKKPWRFLTEEELTGYLAERIPWEVSTDEK